MPRTDWTVAGEFGAPGFAREVLGLTYAAGQFIAVGFQESLDVRGSVGPHSATPLAWASPDGYAWTSISLGEAFTNAQLQSVVMTPDGSALIYGFVTQPGGFEPSRQAAWVSADGMNWSEVELALPGGRLSRIVAGAQGYLTVADDGEGSEVWYSDDGVSWEVTELRLTAEGDDFVTINDLAAGDDGFVATIDYGNRNGDAPEIERTVLASSDGRTWIEAAAADIPPEGSLLVAAVEGDWVMTAFVSESAETTVWWSADGLAWEQRTGVDVPPPADMDPATGARPIVGDIVGAGDGVILNGAVLVCCHAPWWGAGVWWSADAHEWTRLDMREDTFVAQVASHEGVTVLAGHTGASFVTGWAAAATFWVSDRR